MPRSISAIFSLLFRYIMPNTKRKPAMGTKIGIRNSGFMLLFLELLQNLRLHPAATGYKIKKDFSL
jgi:hypothetical protein